MELSVIIKKFREDNSLTMQEFANMANLSKGYISMIENGRNPQNKRALVPSIETYSKLAGAMGISLDDLVLLLDGARVRLNAPSSSVQKHSDEYLIINAYRNADSLTRDMVKRCLGISTAEDKEAIVDRIVRKVLREEETDTPDSAVR